MDQYSPTHLSITTSNRLKPKLDKLKNIGSDQDPHSPTDLKPVTKTIAKEPKMKRSYVQTPNGLRQKLIEAVFKHGEQVKTAAYRLGINYSSAKSICQLYKREGRSAKKTSRSWYSEREKEVMFASCNDNSLEDSTKEEVTQNFSDNLASWETFIRDSLLAIKDPVMRAYPTIQLTNKQAIATGIEEAQNGSKHYIFSQVQPLVSELIRQKIYSQNLYPQIIKTTVSQQPLICPSAVQSKTQSPPMYPLSTDAVISGLIPSVSMQAINSQGLTIPIYPPPQQKIAYVYAYAYPQNTNIVSSQVGGAPTLLNLVSRIQNTNSQFMTNAFLPTEPLIIKSFS